MLRAGFPDSISEMWPKSTICSMAMRFLNRELVRLLRDFIDRLKNGPLFRARCRDGVPMTSRQARRRVRMWYEKAGVNGGATPHALRHSFAQGLLNRTGDIALVQAALHHQSIESTLVYARASTERIRRAVTTWSQPRAGVPDGSCGMWHQAKCTGSTNVL